MTFINDSLRKEMEPMLNSLKRPVNLVFFTQKTECRFCVETRGLLTEISKLSPGINLEILDFQGDQSRARELGVDKIPATVVMADENLGIRFFGIPGGYEFASMLDAIHMVSQSETELSPQTQTFLDNLQKEIHLQVFVTPTCPYCPAAVTLAHRMAHYSPRVTADMVEATEFPHLAQKYNVMGVPRTVINESAFLEGAAPESMLVEKIRTVL
ncbi:MAG TPA: glutaredoxin [Candidatus Aminicenantes bacterium]|nr:glutaredoxin [Candidatus Aminicenantes bacterium]